MIHTGYILAAICSALKESYCREIAKEITLDGRQGNGLHGIHQARVTLQGDPTTYRLIIAPADAPLEIGGRPIGEHFALPLGDR